jgi:hypothetical protein
MLKAQRALTLEADLRRSLQHRSILIPSEIDTVVADVNRFTATILSRGFRIAVNQLPIAPPVRLDRPFLEVCDAIVEYHLAPIKEEDRDLVGKSLFEAYIYFAGTQHVFEPGSKTRLMHSLRRRGITAFSELFLSLHLFNVVSMEIQDKVGAGTPDLESFEFYMLSMEALCRDIVTHAMKIPEGELDERWAAAVRMNIEAQLLSRR